MGRRTAALTALAVFLLGAPAAAAGDDCARVRQVIDGDTIVLESGEHVRLIGINAPEYQPWKGKKEPYGKEAKDFLIRLLQGKVVCMETDIEKRDRYNRLLAYVYLEDGQMANRLLTREGLAKARYYRPNQAHRGELESDQESAVLTQKGLWSKSSR